MGRSCSVLGQRMAFRASSWGRGLPGRHRFGGGGGWGLAKAVAAGVAALSLLAGDGLAQAPDKVAAISGNPAATDFGITGTGLLGRTLGLKDEWGVTLGG